MVKGVNDVNGDKKMWDVHLFHPISYALEARTWPNPTEIANIGGRPDFRINAKGGWMVKTCYVSTKMRL